MRSVRFESLGGASGDMVLAALAGLGADLDAVARAVASLGVEPFRIERSEVAEGGLRGTRVTVHAEAAHGNGVHAHPHAHGRSCADIRALIERGALSERARRESLAVFRRLAEAEALVHGTTPDEVHFHEVGALDSIVDIVGACVALDLLGAERVECAPLPEGHGAVRTAHGLLPVPAPATVELLRGFPVTQTDEPFELVTPTGAALLTTWVALSAPSAEQAAGPRVTLAWANAFGHRRLQGRPNLLRARLMETAPAAGAGEDECLVLECNLDDTVPELIGALTQALLAAGALDAFTTAVQMKKQRPGTLLTALCLPQDRAALLDLLFRESTTFGVREHTARRTVLARRFEEARTPYGVVRVKVGTWRGRDVTRSPEHEDCARLARERGVAVRAVYEAALRALSA
jgi:pyridinium-3,5-bisthiocarboxylic acid mononucleotide nickel chelatase